MLNVQTASSGRWQQVVGPAACSISGWCRDLAWPETSPQFNAKEGTATRDVTPRRTSSVGDAAEEGRGDPARELPQSVSRNDGRFSMEGAYWHGISITSIKAARLIESSSSSTPHVSPIPVLLAQATPLPSPHAAVLSKLSSRLSCLQPTQRCS